MSPNISIIIVDDDLNKIYNIIKTIKEVTETPISYHQAESISEANDYLKENKYHLLISDILMPLHKQGDLLNNGGEILVKELYKVRKGFKMPLYIVGLTQFKEYIGNFNKLWKVLIYDPANEEWKIYLRDLIAHIIQIKDYLATNLLETIFVEGISDKIVLEKALKLYFPDIETKLLIDSIKYGGGASWVERKTLIWAKSLNKSEDGKYIKAIGLFDNDTSGLKSLNNVLELIDEKSAEYNTFSLVKTEKKFSVFLKEISKKGLEIFTTIEDLVDVDVWRDANEKGWLEKRPTSSFINIDEVNITEEYFKTLGLNEDQVFKVLHCVKDENKIGFANLAGESKANLLEVSYLLEHCLEKLKIIK